MFEMFVENEKKHDGTLGVDDDSEETEDVLSWESLLIHLQQLNL